MRTQSVITITILVLCCPRLSGASDASKAHTYQSIEKAFQAKAIRLSLTGNSNGHSGNCISLSITNKSHDSAYYVVEAGRRLDSEDSTVQDILVAKEQQLAMAPNETRHIQVFGFCCQLHNSSPCTRSKFSVGKMGNKNLVARWLNL